MTYRWMLGTILVRWVLPKVKIFVIDLFQIFTSAARRIAEAYEQLEYELITEGGFRNFAFSFIEQVSLVISSFRTRAKTIRLFKTAKR